MKILAQMFGSAARIKMMRLFIFNSDDFFDLRTVSKRSKVRVETARKELRLLEKIGFVKKKTTKTKVGNTKRFRSQKGWELNKKFPLVFPLQDLLIDSQLIQTKDLPKRFRPAGMIKAIILSGLFLKDENREVDLLLVGNKLNRTSVSKIVKNLEAEIGRELRYAVFDTKEFNYRLGMYDALLLDVFEHSHELILDKIGLGEEVFASTGKN